MQKFEIGDFVRIVDGEEKFFYDSESYGIIIEQVEKKQKIWEFGKMNRNKILYSKVKFLNNYGIWYLPNHSLERVK